MSAAMVALGDSWVSADHARSSSGAAIVTPDELSHLIHASARWSGPLSRRAIDRTVQDCWPGGMSDHFEPSALAWLARWRPERIGAVLPHCSCATGHCALCN